MLPSRAQLLALLSDMVGALSQPVNGGGADFAECFAVSRSSELAGAKRQSDAMYQVLPFYLDVEKVRALRCGAEALSVPNSSRLECFACPAAGQ